VATTLDRPCAVADASFKPHQLTVAAECGLNVPVSLVVKEQIQAWERRARGAGSHVRLLADVASAGVAGAAARRRATGGGPPGGSLASWIACRDGLPCSVQGVVGVEQYPRHPHSVDSADIATGVRNARRSRFLPADAANVALTVARPKVTSPTHACPPQNSQYPQSP
jgi:hypothetical protein